MERDEIGTLRTLNRYRAIIDRLIASHRGRIFNTAGDSLVADFASAVDAVQCAIEVQEAIAKENADRPAGEQMRFRIGLHVGDIIVQNENLFGDAVNVAARLEALAEPGGICVSRVVRDQIRDKLPYAFEDMGEQKIKNIARPVRAYTLSIAAGAASSTSAATAAHISGPATPPTAPRLSIVVLPFANLSNDSEQEYFADGITDDLTTDLSRISGSFVIARNTAFTYKGKPIDAKQIGRELGVRYVLEGSVRRTGDRVRVNAQLIDAANGAHIWADRIDTDRFNLVQTQDEITGRLARTLDLELAAELGRRIERESPANADSRDLVMRGRAWWYRPVSAANRAEARRLFQNALELDPQSVDAQIGLAWVLTSSYAEGWTSSFEEDSVRAEQMLLEALEAAPNRSMADTAMGFLRRVQNRLTEARVEEETAIVLDPNNDFAYRHLGWVLLFLGEPSAAILQAEKAIRLSPHDTNIWGVYGLLGWCRLLLNDVDQAIDLLIKARTSHPRVWWVHFVLAGALGLKGNLDEAKTALARSMQIKPEVNSLRQFLVYFPSGTNQAYWALHDSTLNEGCGGWVSLKNDRHPPSRRDPRCRCGGVFAADRR
jgi:TolB-like protein/Tfp pilus assembly protein PilF